MTLGTQIVWLFIMAIPIACISWTVTHEDVFREPRDYCREKSQTAAHVWRRKFFYLFTCEYCFSHYVTALFLIITRYHLLYNDWRGYLVSFFSLPFVANVYIALLGQVKLGVTRDRVEIKAIEEQANSDDMEERPRLERPAA